MKLLKLLIRLSLLCTVLIFFIYFYLYFLYTGNWLSSFYYIYFRSQHRNWIWIFPIANERCYSRNVFQVSSVLSLSFYYVNCYEMFTIYLLTVTKEETDSHFECFFEYLNQAPTQFDVRAPPYPGYFQNVVYASIWIFQPIIKPLSPPVT